MSTGSRRVSCPADGCPGVEMHDGKPDGCGHPTKTSGCRSREALLAAEVERRRRQMVDAKDALARGDGKAAWDALNSHEAVA